MYIILIFIVIVITLVIYFYLHKRELYTGTLRVAGDIDYKRATKFALQKMCTDRGLTWVQGGDEFSYDCKYNKDSCLKASKYPTLVGDNPSYYEWRDSSSTDFINANVNALQDNTINTGDNGGICIIGNEMYRNFCETNNLTYNPQDGSCVTNKNYCLTKVLPFCNGDCYVPPNTWLTQNLFGTTLGRALTAPQSYLVDGICELDTKVKNK
jgi:hypothetical protein